jgi:acyl-CoA thioesterase
MVSLTAMNKEGRNKFAELLGIRFSKIEDGVCVAELDVTEDHFHPGMIVHGGVAFSLADTSMALALISKLESGKTCNTIETKISYLSAVTAGTMKASARIIKQGRSVAFLESEVKVGDQVVASATASFAVVDLPAMQAN